MGSPSCSNVWSRLQESAGYLHISTREGEERDTSAISWVRHLSRHATTCTTRYKTKPSNYLSICPISKLKTQNLKSQVTYIVYITQNLTSVIIPKPQIIKSDYNQYIQNNPQISQNLKSINIIIFFSFPFLLPFYQIFFGLFLSHTHTHTHATTSCTPWDLYDIKVTQRRNVSQRSRKSLACLQRLTDILDSHDLLPRLDPKSSQITTYNYGVPNSTK